MKNWSKGEIYEILKDKELSAQVEAVDDFMICIFEISKFSIADVLRIHSRIDGRIKMLRQNIKKMEVNEHTKIITDMLSVIENKISEVEDFVISNQKNKEL
jgi:hypothetical protein